MCLGIPGRIVGIVDAERKLAMVDVSGVQRVVNVACVVEDDAPIESCVGYWVLVHVGFAMSRIDEDEAAATLKGLNELGGVKHEVAGRGDAGVGRGMTGGNKQALQSLYPFLHGRKQDPRAMNAALLEAVGEKVGRHRD